MDAFSGSDEELDRLVDQFLWQFKDTGGMPLSWVADFKAQARQAKAESRSLMRERKEARRQARNARARKARRARREAEHKANPKSGGGTPRWQREVCIHIL